MANCCCTRDDDRKCAYCFSGQTWVSDFSGSDIRLGFTAGPNQWWDQLFSASDSVAGSCHTVAPPTWYLPNTTGAGYDSHTYAVYSRLGPVLWAGNIFNSFGTDQETQTAVLTEQGNSFNFSPTPTKLIPGDGTQIYLGQMVSSKFHSVTIAGAGSAVFNPFSTVNLYDFPVDLRGFFRFPISALMAENFERTYRATIELKTVGGDIAQATGPAAADTRPMGFDTGFVGPMPGLIGIQRAHILSTHSMQPFGRATVFACLGSERNCNFPIENGDDYLEVSGTLASRPVFLELTSFFSDLPKFYRLGITFGDIANSNYSVVLEIEQTGPLENIENGGFENWYEFSVEYQMKISVPEASFSETVTTDQAGNNWKALVNRCSFGYAKVYALPEVYPGVFQIDHGDFQASTFGNTTPEKYMLSNSDPEPWMNELNSLGREQKKGVLTESILIDKAVSDFRLSDAQTEVAGFRCIRAEQIRSSAVIASIDPTDFDDFTIPHNTTWEVSVNDGDTFKVYFDNLGLSLIHI